MATGMQLFGVPAYEHEGVVHLLPAERRGQLLAYLALRRSWVPRGEVAALLWPEQQTHLALANLRKTLFRLAALKWAAPVQAQGGAIRADVATDVEAFEAALREHRLDQALALRRGEFLVGFDDDANPAWTSWLGFERDRLRVAWRGAALERLGGEIGASEGIELSARLLETDPLDEAALREHMRWLAQDGQAGRARQVYRDFVDRMQHELGLAPGAELRAQHDQLGSATPAPLAQPVHADDGFIGRSVELRRIAEMLVQPGCRLLSLVGPGGVGKTRLARRAMAELAAHHADGAVFVALEDVTRTDEVGAVLARELGVSIGGKTSPMQQVIEALGARQLLLVLDNLEQLAHEAHWLDELVQGCPRLHLIVTSRVRPASASAWLLPLEGLPCPEPEDADHAEAFDSVRLFVRAAQRVAPSLDLAAEAAAIVEICRRVGGLPLALELAASWTRVLPCQAIAAELGEGPGLLRTTDTSRPARHASIEAVFDQSWRHLAAAERDVLARLSVFRGGFTAEATRVVANASLPVLGALVDKSLLHKEGGRLSLHPLVQELAAERLGGEAAREATVRAHGRYFLRMLTGLRRALRHAHLEALRQVDAEFDNVRTAWRWAIQHGAGDDLGHAAFGLVSYCDHRGRRAEGLALLREAIAGSDDAGAGGAAPAILVATAHLEYRLDRYAEAEALATLALAGGRRVGDAHTQQLSATVLGACALRLGRVDDAQRWLEAALRVAKRAGDATHIAGTLDNLGMIEKSRGRLDAAIALYQQALLQHRAMGDAGAEAMSLNNLGVVHVLRGQSDVAREMLRAGRALCERHGLPSVRCMIENNLADLALEAGDLDATLSHARAALELSETTAQRAIAVNAREHLMLVALRRGDFATARAELPAAAEGALAIGRPALQAECIARFAELLGTIGERAAAVRLMACVLAQDALLGVVRDDARASIRRWGADPDAVPAWHGPSIPEVVQRIVVETDIAHEALVASLRGD